MLTRNLVATAAQACRPTLAHVIGPLFAICILPSRPPPNHSQRRSDPFDPRALAVIASRVYRFSFRVTFYVLQSLGVQEQSVQRKFRHFTRQQIADTRLVFIQNFRELRL